MGKIEARKSRRSKKPSSTKRKRVASKRNKITIANPVIEAQWDKKMVRYARMLLDTGKSHCEESS